jgi:hypothetical protein
MTNQLTITSRTSGTGMPPGRKYAEAKTTHDIRMTPAPKDNSILQVNFSDQKFSMFYSKRCVKLLETGEAAK